MLDNPIYQDAIKAILQDNSVFKYDDFKDFLLTLDNFTSSHYDLSKISATLGSLIRVFSCFDVNRLVSVNSEKELTSLAAKLYANGTFLAGKQP